MKAEFIRCACTRMNDPWRHYCGGCGRKLQPACSCGFVNARSDAFCGGCGDPVHVTATTEQTTIPIEILEVIR
jgi:hypothetical protein